MKIRTVIHGIYCIDNNGDMHKDIEWKHTQNINSFMQIHFSILLWLNSVKMQTIIRSHADVLFFSHPICSTSNISLLLISKVRAYTKVRWQKYQLQHLSLLSQILEIQKCWYYFETYFIMPKLFKFSINLTLLSLPPGKLKINS